MAITRIQQVVSSSGSGTTVVPITSSGSGSGITNHTLLALVLTNLSPVVTSCTDSASQSYLTDFDINFAGICQATAFRVPKTIAGVTSITITSSGGFAWVWAIELSGTDGSAAPNIATQAGLTGTSATAALALSPTNNDYIVALSANNTGVGISAGSGYQLLALANQYNAAIDLTGTSFGPGNTTPTFNFDSSCGWCISALGISAALNPDENYYIPPVFGSNSVVTGF